MKLIIPISCCGFQINDPFFAKIVHRKKVSSNDNMIRESGFLRATDKIARELSS